MPDPIDRTAWGRPAGNRDRQRRKAKRGVYETIGADLWLSEPIEAWSVDPLGPVSHA